MGTGRRLAPEGLKAFVQRRRNAGCKPARAEVFFSMGRPEASRKSRNVFFNGKT
jgi:hypothetical protein